MTSSCNIKYIKPCVRLKNKSSYSGRKFDNRVLMTMRRGMFRLCLRYNVPIVPCYGFRDIESMELAHGCLETNMWSKDGGKDGKEVVPLFNQIIRRIISFIYGLIMPALGFVPLLISAFPDVETTLVVGKPIDMNNPSGIVTEELVEEKYQEYCGEIKRIYSRYVGFLGGEKYEKELLIV
jgi:hypothetical protein